MMEPHSHPGQNHGRQDEQAHGRDHGHGHHHGLYGHHHDVGANMTLALGLSVFATLTLVCVELVAGYLGHSIALVSDGIHNLTDAPTLALAWLAARWASRPPTREKTYGYHRAGILAAFVNATMLTLASLLLVYESVRRLRSPVEVGTTIMMWVSLVALVVNGGITFAVHAGRKDLNVRAVWIHNLGDALSNIAIFAAALLIRFFGVHWIDPLIGIGIGAMVLWSGTGVLRESGHILLEGMPREMNLEDVANAVLRVDGVREVHDIHIWTLGTDLNALSCHIRIPDMHMEESERILEKVRDVLARDFQIAHTTVQFERAGLPAEAGLYMPEPVRQSEK
ncbi:MAG TPA: cation diffusion facilitator family transporter [Candidatus Acidoferrum sp.]|jgi:cobalt-zinc-cadmium efflux system protein|nr:cation diffusion facilitator family transporter [Candidatus Acidoferrum sp.]